MTCAICKTGELGAGHTTVSIGRGETTIVTENVPAEVCDNCGEAYLSATITEQLQHALEQALRDQVRVGRKKGRGVARGLSGSRWRKRELVCARRSGHAHGIERPFGRGGRRLDQAPRLLIVENFGGQLRVQGVPRAMRYDMADDWPADQRQVADDIENRSRRYVIR